MQRAEGPDMSNFITPNLDPRALAKEISGKLIIGGVMMPASSGKSFEVINPATGEIIGEAAFGEAIDVDAAVAAAEEAQVTWARLPARERGNLVAKCGRVLSRHVEELARLVALETGKALRTESRPEATGLPQAFNFYGGLALEITGETVPFDPKMLTMTVREPIGVVGAIIPWNVPMMIMAVKIAPALVAGNTVVVKSAEEAPFAVLRVCQIMQQILPPGVFNILTGYGPECGAPLVAHPKVGKVTFTGSVEVGKIVNKVAAEKLIPVTLELGGKCPMIVMPDVDVDKAVDGAIVGMRFTRQGQSCTAQSRIFVHESIHNKFVEKLIGKVNELKLGDPLHEDTDIGAIISPQQFERVQSYIAIGKDSQGAKAHTCCKLPNDSRLNDGLFVQPVIFTGINENNKIAREEIFGPVACIFKWSDYDDVIEQANDTVYGLAATVWTRDLKIALDATHRLKAGFVQVNQAIGPQPGLSYGGYKRSGLGKEYSFQAMLDHFTQTKTIIINMA
jgi:aldehyde dehydrogenase (NAD+)